MKVIAFQETNTKLFLLSSEMKIICNDTSLILLNTVAPRSDKT